MRKAFFINNSLTILLKFISNHSRIALPPYRADVFKPKREVDGYEAFYSERQNEQCRKIREQIHQVLQKMLVKRHHLRDAETPCGL